MKRQVTQHEIGDVVASSPWMRMSPAFAERYVVRLFKPQEYAVHRESRMDNAKESTYIWGSYFSWKGDGGEPERLIALNSAWANMSARATSSLLAYKL